ncbi:lytic transglycosylase domain-containing protein [Fibrella aquatica]|uniref:lytic transglycosylase domain-containing protein n=1 Tax=Fibrella aquatica TaxID=3242487 RepID=UPI003520A43E
MKLLNLLTVCSVSWAVIVPDAEAQVARPTPTVTYPASSNQVANLAVADTMVLDTAFLVETVLNLPSVPEAVLRERLPRLQRQIPLPYNKVVHNFVDYFIYRKPSYTRTVMERMPFYFPLYEKTLAKHKMPDELKYLSIVESALNPRAMSRVGAGGLWQFMPYTGKDFNLNIDDYVDDRMDPAKSTEAACRYLKDLYRIFGDWELSLAAYNCGPGAVRRAMRRTGGATFWTCYEGLPKETRSYVPQFIAMTYIMNYGPDHGIVAERPDYPIVFDTLQINSYLDLKTFASLSNISFADLQKLNPAITADRLPEYTRNHALRIPSERYSYVQTYRQIIMDSASKMPVMMENMLLAHNELLTNRATTTIDPDGGWILANRLADNAPDTDGLGTVVAENTQPEPDDLTTVVMRKPRKLTHTVRRGETLSGIADKYDVALLDVKQWNKLRFKTVKTGQKLTILRESGETHTERMARQETIPSASKERREVASKSRHERVKPKYHLVQPGDTLWNIARRYGNISIEQLKKMNRIKGDSVRPGQKLVVG